MKKILAVLITAILWLTACGETTAMKEKAEGLSPEQQEIATIWAKALASRDGKGRYDHMSEACQEVFEEEQRMLLGDDWNYVIGFSSPWVVSYEIDGDGEEAVITYTMEDNSYQYIVQEILKFGVENGKTVVTEYYYDDVKEEAKNG